MYQFAFHTLRAFTFLFLKYSKAMEAMKVQKGQKVVKVQVLY